MGKIYGMAGNGGTHKWGVVYSFDVGLGPFVSLVSTTGKVGITIEVLGQGFTGTTAVSFNGTAATFTVVSDTYLKTTVPSGATTGFVTVTTPGGTLTSNKEFRVKP
ncbi:MAG TPA: IPT/TIG domain-containing protein [Terriglobales bacterium]|nr:IPT/TIG domain-containing protein [Terriglobales bacterium]